MQETNVTVRDYLTIIIIYLEIIKRLFLRCRDDSSLYKVKEDRKKLSIGELTCCCTDERKIILHL